MQCIHVYKIQEKFTRCFSAYCCGLKLILVWPTASKRLDSTALSNSVYAHLNTAILIIKEHS